MSNNILDNYEDILLDLITNNKDAKIGLAEFGRGDGSLYNYLKDKVAEVHVIEDWNQTIFQADRNNYNDCENLIEYNVLSTYNLEEQFDVLYCSLPNFVPNMPVEVYQTRLNKGFANLYNALYDKGKLITVDYNVKSIKDAIIDLGCPVAKYIQTNEGIDPHFAFEDYDDLLPEYYICVATKHDWATSRKHSQGTWV